MNHVLSRYATARWCIRFHTRLRWWSCPAAAIESEVPPNGDVLEIGCGHGLLAVHLALTAPGRRVRGVDIDAAKIAAARAAADGAASFDLVAPGFIPRDPSDAVVIVDVLYLMSSDAQRRLLTAAARALRPGGVLVIKEMGTKPRWKLQWTRIQETLATRVIKITAHTGAGLNFLPPEDMTAWLRAEGLEVTVRRVDKGYPSPHVLVVARRSQRVQ